jgi:hypothetical protein
MTTDKTSATAAADEAPAWRATRMTAVGPHNQIYDAGRVVYGARPTVRSGLPNVDFVADNAAAEAAVTAAAGGVRLVSKPSLDTSIPPAPFPGMELLEVVSGTPRYIYKRGEPAPEPEVDQPRFRFRGSRSAHIGGQAVEPGMQFEARFIVPHQRHMVEPLNDKARDVLTHEFHPDPAA